MIVNMSFSIFSHHYRARPGPCDCHYCTYYSRLMVIGALLAIERLQQSVEVATPVPVHLSMQS